MSRVTGIIWSWIRCHLFWYPRFCIRTKKFWVWLCRYVSHQAWNFFFSFTQFCGSVRIGIIFPDPQLLNNETYDADVKENENKIKIWFPPCVKLRVGFGAGSGMASKWKVGSGSASKRCRSTTLLQQSIYLVFKVTLRCALCTVSCDVDV